jgi:hypothetical protein
MSSHSRARPVLYMWLLVLCVITVLGFVVALPWLRQQADSLVFVFTGVAATIVIMASLLFDIINDRKLGEWERSNSRFSTRWGWAVGSSLVALLLAFPPVHNVIVHWAGVWGDVADPDRRLVLVTFTFGFATMAIVQTLCMVLISVGWTFWKSRPGQEGA